MNRYYLHAMGSICYDNTGITFPEQLDFNLTQLAKLAGASEVHWERQFGWNNQPEVLCFGYFVTDDQQIYLSMLQTIVRPMGLLIKDHWNYEDKNLPF